MFAPFITPSPIPLLSAWAGQCRVDLFAAIRGFAHSLAANYGARRRWRNSGRPGAEPISSQFDDPLRQPLEHELERAKEWLGIEMAFQLGCWIIQDKRGLRGSNIN